MKIALQNLSTATPFTVHRFSAKSFAPTIFNNNSSTIFITICCSPIYTQFCLYSYNFSPNENPEALKTLETFKMLETLKTFKTLETLKTLKNPEILDEGKPSVSGLEDSKDADTICRLLMEQHNPYHAMEGAMQLNGIHVTPELACQVLLRLKNASKVALGFFVWAKEQAGYQHSVIAYNIMIDIVGKVRQFDVAWQLIIEMGQIFPQVCVKTFAILIRRYIAAGLVRQAVKAFDDMESFLERQPTGEDFKMLLDTLCKYRFSRVATQLFNKRKTQYLPDTKSYNILIYGWCKCNKAAVARRLFNEMIVLGCEPSVVTYNIFLEEICGRNKLNEFRFGRMKHAAEKLLDEMKGRGCVPDVTTYSILMHGFGRAFKADECFRLLNEMKENGCCPNVVTYTCIVKCLCILGKLDKAHKMLDEMIESGVHPTAATFNCFFKELGGCNEGDEALKLYKRMQEPPILCKPTNQTYHILLRMFCRWDRMDVALDIWNDMHQKGNGHDLDAYTLLIHSLIGKARWREACIYFVQMIEKGYLPQTVTFKTLYKGLIQSDKLRSWRRLKNKLTEESGKFKQEFEGYHLKPYQR